MKKTFTFAALLLVYLLCGHLSAQKSVDFGLIQSSAAAIEVNEVIDSAKWRRANDIYQRLVNARGDYRFAAPPLKLSGNEANIAFLEAGGQSIGIEMRAYSLLDELGDEAFAFILGHEVSHFYEKHGRKLGNYKELLDTEFNNALSAAKKEMASEDAYNKLAVEITRNRKRGPKVASEIEADYLGGFLAYSAGYDISGVPEVFAKLYEAYKLDTAEVYSYVSLKERQQMARDAMQQLEEFIDIFELANVLTVMRRYPEARTLYRYILEEYQGREIYNNLGVLTTLEAISMFNLDELYYRLPLELDLNFASNSRGGDEDKVLREKLLREALGYFTAAINLDRDYATGYLNMACVHFILRDYERAGFYANIEAMQKARQNAVRFPMTAQNATIINALIKLNTGQEEQGKAILDSLKTESTLAKINLTLYEDEGPERISRPVAPNDLYWSVDGLDRKQLATASQSNKEAKNKTLFDEMVIRIWDRPKSKVYKVEYLSNLDRPDIVLAISDADTDEQPGKKFGVGSSSDDLEQYYGPPHEVVSTPSGEVWMYNDHHFLIIGQDKKLKRWIVAQ